MSGPHFVLRDRTDVTAETAEGRGGGGREGALGKEVWFFSEDPQGVGKEIGEFQQDPRKFRGANARNPSKILISLPHPVRETEGG